MKTLEEAAERYDKKYIEYVYDAFIEGAKWQQERMYSEEEIIDMMFELLNQKKEECCITNTRDSIVRKVFKQFKKK
jgi:hypothetical protein